MTPDPDPKKDLCHLGNKTTETRLHMQYVQAIYTSLCFIIVSRHDSAISTVAVMHSANQSKLQETNKKNRNYSKSTGTWSELNNIHNINPRVFRKKKLHITLDMTW